MTFNLQETSYTKTSFILFTLSFLGLILLFYSALYIFLAAMFGGCMCCLMWSISPYTPTYNDRVMPPGGNKPFLCVKPRKIIFNA